MSSHDNKARRHQEYFLPDGDIIIRVEESVFRMHRYFLVRESKYFRSILVPTAPCRDPPGSSETNPVVLKDATSEGFASLLWVFYNPEYSIYKAPLEKWKQILTLAQHWGFVQVEKLCIRELEDLSIPPVEKIQLYQDFGISPVLLHSSYVELTTRLEPLDVEEGRKLGIATSLKIAHARELARAPDRATGLFSPATEIQSVIESVFGLQGSAPPPSTTPPQKQNTTTDDHTDKRTGAEKTRNKQNK